MLMTAYCIPIFIMLRIHVDKIEYYCAHGYVLGSSDFDKIFENCFASCSFGLAKDI
jgi:hypothetical protein